MVDLHYISGSKRWEYELLSKRETDNLSYKMRSDVTVEIRAANDAIPIAIKMSPDF
jgi:hypothetical protein